MEISKPDGTQIDTVSFPFDPEETGSGRFCFAPIIDDPQIDTLKLDVHLTTLGKTEIISNLIITTVSLDDPTAEEGTFDPSAPFFE